MPERWKSQLLKAVHDAMRKEDYGLASARLGLADERFGEVMELAEALGTALLPKQVEHVDKPADTLMWLKPDEIQVPVEELLPTIPVNLELPPLADAVFESARQALLRCAMRYSGYNKQGREETPTKERCAGTGLLDGVHCDDVPEGEES
jgi:hypothetical protein